MSDKKTAWWPIKFWWGRSFNGPAEWNFGGGKIINYVLCIYGVSLGTRFLGVITTEIGPRPWTFREV